MSTIFPAGTPAQPGGFGLANADCVSDVYPSAAAGTDAGRRSSTLAKRRPSRCNENNEKNIGRLARQYRKLLMFYKVRFG
jgi:hypothetical protein